MPKVSDAIRLVEAHGWRWTRNEAENARGRQRRRLAKDARIESRVAVPVAPMVAPVDPPRHTVAEVAAVFGIGQQTITAWIGYGRLYGVRMGGATRGMFLIPASEIARVQAERPGGPKKPMPRGWKPSPPPVHATLGFATSLGIEQPGEPS